MPIPSGLSAQLGIVDEVTYGTPVVVTRFYEFTEESMQMEIERIESSGLRGGVRVQRSDRWISAQKNVNGEITMELAQKSFGLWFKHMLGGVATTQPNVGTDPTVFDHTFTPGDLPVSFTAQLGRPDSTGTVRAFTYHGCRVSEWEISADTGEIPTLTVTVLGEDEDTATALAVASYPASAPLYTFLNGSCTINATAQEVKSFSISGNNQLADDRFYFGSALRKQPVEAGMREYTGEMTVQFTDLTNYNLFKNGTEATFVGLFRGSTITGTYFHDLQITANIRADGETPQVGGPEMLEQTMAYKITGNTPATALSILYRTTDTLP